MTNFRRTRVVRQLKTNWLIPIIINLIAGGLLYAVALPLVALVLLSITLIAGISSYFTYKSFKHELRDAGISEVIPFGVSDNPITLIPLDERLKYARRRVIFMGISAKSLWDSCIFDMMGNLHNRGCTFKFLLINPEGEALKRFIQRENITDADSARQDIQSFTTRLRKLRSQLPSMTIHLNYFDFSPPFWLLLCDDTLYVQTFPANAIGKNSPLMILKKQSSEHPNLFDAFELYLEEASKHLSLSVDLSE